MKIIARIITIPIVMGAAVLLTFSPVKVEAEPVPDLPEQSREVAEVQEEKQDENLVPWARKNYSFAYWQNGWRKSPDDSSTDILCFETGHYGFTLNLEDVQKVHFGFFNDDIDYPEALEADTRRVDTLEPAELVIEVKSEGSVYRATTCKAALSSMAATMAPPKPYKAPK